MRECERTIACMVRMWGGGFTRRVACMRCIAEASEESVTGAQENMSRGDDCNTRMADVPYLSFALSCGAADS